MEGQSSEQGSPQGALLSGRVQQWLNEASVSDGPAPNPASSLSLDKLTSVSSSEKEGADMKSLPQRVLKKQDT